MIEVISGNITTVAVDAIVNAANSSLMGGGGVDGAIHKAGGPAILEECIQIHKEQGDCKPGDAVITTAGLLPSRFVIHTVGPVWKGGNNREREILASCYIKSLELAREHNCRTIAFPNISTGVYGFPKKEAAIVSVKTIKEFTFHKTDFDRIVLVCFDAENFNLLRELVKEERN